MAPALLPVPENPRGRLYYPDSGSFEADVQFGEGVGWARLHDNQDWAAMVDGRHCRLSEAQQRRQFLSFFPTMHPLRHSPTGTLPLFLVLQAVCHALRKRSALMWFRLVRQVRSRCAFRRYLHEYVEGLRQRREAVLEGWLGFWRAAELRAAVEARRQVQAPPHPSVSKQLQARQVLRRSMVVTPDSIKVAVLWQLYWLLHTQVNRRVGAHWRRWRGLLRQADELRDGCEGPVFLLDFSLAEAPQTLPAVHAALFVQALRRPSKSYPTGREVTFRELLRLADCLTALPEWAAVPSPASISSTMAGFLTSPLCEDPLWMASRYGQPASLIPPCTWAPVVCHPIPVRPTAPAEEVDPLLASRRPSTRRPTYAAGLAASQSLSLSLSGPLHPLSQLAKALAASPPLARRRTLSPHHSLPALGPPRGRSSLPRGQLRPWMVLPLPDLPGDAGARGPETVQTAPGPDSARSPAGSDAARTPAGSARRARRGLPAALQAAAQQCKA
eukprot:EG_transcript_9531